MTPPPSGESLADLSATELLRRFAAGDLSPVDVTRAVIARVERLEPKLRALYLFRPEDALAAARESERRWRAGEARALEGVPVTIKENIATAGDPMPLGTAARELLAAPADAPPAARLREAGAVILAKTTMPDYGMLSSGLSSFHPVSRNPWDLSRTPGGSSAGAGAAAAAGYGPVHLGTDIGGSIRLPAGWCGVVGLKPSFGRVPVDPPYWGRAAGPMTRTVADAALAMRELSRPDGRDGMSLPPAALRFEAGAMSPKGLRIGLWREAGIGLPVDPEVAAAVEAAARLFEAAGAVVEPVAPFLTRSMIDGLDRFWRQRAWADISALSDAQRGKILPYIREWAEGGRDLTGAEVYHGVSQFGAMRDAALAATGAFAFVLSPVAPVAAFAAELASPLHDPARPFEHIGFTVPFNFSEQPAISVPCGMTGDGLPIGVQIAGRRFDDEGVLSVAAAFEHMRGELPPWPNP
ncbi:amidase [Enterovirga sp.]|uniref:amidase n=1 Tax=Enterovirga sp. TaxID=2026350 RepID=UPI00260AA028|nr:amidase [Enterovirga sp.]MDB5590816.1 amidase [Enterovirga sp.]